MPKSTSLTCPLYVMNTFGGIIGSLAAGFFMIPRVGAWGTLMSAGLTSTALAFVLLVEDPTRFRKSRDVGPYLGLVPRLDDSSDARPQLRISKAGDAFARRVLVSAAQYILGPFGPACDLRRYGMAIAERGGKKAKKRAVVAVARKLAVLLHQLWVSGATYDPDYQLKRRAA